MSNVKDGGSKGRAGVPGILELPGAQGTGLIYPPETIERQRNLAKGKAGMTWEHPQLGPHASYVDGEDANAAEKEHGVTNSEPKGRKSMVDSGRGKSGGGSKGKKPMHRSTSGVTGRGILGN